MRNYIHELIETLHTTEIWENVSAKSETYDAGVQRLIECFLERRSKGANVFFIGNGGSSAIASHMTADFMKNGRMNTYSLYDNAVMTCMGNDYGYEYVFSKPMEFLVKADDLVVAISSSGNSPNIINAIQVAKQHGASVITFTGFLPGNTVKQLGDINVYVPCQRYGIVESIHNLILQQIVDSIMEWNMEHEETYARSKTGGFSGPGWSPEC